MEYTRLLQEVERSSLTTLLRQRMQWIDARLGDLSNRSSHRDSHIPQVLIGQVDDWLREMTGLWERYKEL